MNEKIDLNCDVGESYGVYRIGADESLMGWITSANIACGYHAGDPLVMDRTVQDLGRRGYEQYGVPVAGAIDQFALRAANFLVGNPVGVGPPTRLLWK